MRGGFSLLFVGVWISFWEGLGFFLVGCFGLGGLLGFFFFGFWVFLVFGGAFLDIQKHARFQQLQLAIGRH